MGVDMVVIGRLCASTHDAVMNECVAPISNNTSAIWDLTGNIPTIMSGVSWTAIASKWFNLP
jgi:dipeptidase